jgi:hypothetical protein
MKAGGVSTMGSYAFCCLFQPGSTDETLLVDTLTRLLGAAPSPEQMIGLRRLFFESHTLAIVDMRSRLEHNDDQPKKILGPERNSRMAELRLLLPVLTIQGDLEFSNSLLDNTIDQLDRSELRFIHLMSVPAVIKNLMALNVTNYFVLMSGEMIAFVWAEKFQKLKRG